MLLIIDGNNLAHRAKHTFSLSNRGQDVSVTYGTLRILGSLMKKFNPTSVIMCWDGGIPEFRRQRVPSYKAGRERGDPDEYADFIRQLQELSDYALPLMGVVSVRKIGAEADDLMFHASRISNSQCIIVTTDADLLQAAAAGISIYSPTKEKMYTPEKILSQYGVQPMELVHLRALAGDGSDNIAGVRGIGEKTAIKLFAQYDSLAGIVNAAMGSNPKGRISGKIGENIIAFGLDRLTDNVVAMRLGFDLVGAKLALIDAIEYWRPANKTRVKKYFLRHAFASLIDGDFLGAISRLVKPDIYTHGIRLPVVCSRRRPQ